MHKDYTLNIYLAIGFSFRSLESCLYMAFWPLLLLRWLLRALQGAILRSLTRRKRKTRGREKQTAEGWKRQNRREKKDEQERKSRWEAARPGKGRRGVRVWVEEEEEAKRHGGSGGGGGGGWIQADPCVYVCCCVSQWVSSALAPAGNASTKQRQYTHHPLFTPIQSPLMRVTLYMPSAPHRSYQAAV